jgi:hypothetical protein
MKRISLVSYLAMSAALGGSATATAQIIQTTVITRSPANDARTMQPLLEEVGKVSELLAQATDPTDIVRHSLHQADLLRRLAAASAEKEREQWLRQLADCLLMAATHAPVGDRTVYEQLVKFENETALAQPGSKLAGYVTYREVQADYHNQLRKANVDYQKAQEQWCLRLAQYVQLYPRGDDTPDALIELAMVHGVLGHDAVARGWYRKTVQDFPGTTQATKADGAIRRLGLMGQHLALALPLLYAESENRDEPFDLESLQGQPVIVTCWTASSPHMAQDFARLKQLRDRYADVGLELLGVSMNSTQHEAKQFLAGCSVPGVHVFQRGGVQGIWAKRNGVQDVPFFVLVDPDGKVVFQGQGLGELEGELARRVK